MKDDISMNIKPKGMHFNSRLEPTFYSEAKAVEFAIFTKAWSPTKSNVYLIVALENGVLKYVVTGWEEVEEVDLLTYDAYNYHKVETKDLGKGLVKAELKLGGSVDPDMRLPLIENRYFVVTDKNIIDFVGTVRAPDLNSDLIAHILEEFIGRACEYGDCLRHNWYSVGTPYMERFISIAIPLSDEAEKLKYLIEVHHVNNPSNEESLPEPEGGQVS